MPGINRYLHLIHPLFSKLFIKQYLLKSLFHRTVPRAFLCLDMDLSCYFKECIHWIRSGSLVNGNTLLTSDVNSSSTIQTRQNQQIKCDSRCYKQMVMAARWFINTSACKSVWNSARLEPLD